MNCLVCELSLSAVSLLSEDCSGLKAVLSGCLFPLEGFVLGQSWVLKEGGGGGGGGGLLLKLTHILLLRPWVLPAPGGDVGWICRSFHGPLIFKMGLWSGQSEVNEKYWPVRERMGSHYQRFLVVTNGYKV